MLTMKLLFDTSHTSGLLLFIGTLLISAVSGEVVRIIFNNGNEATSNAYCTDNDYRIINEEIEKLSRISFRTRNLRSTRQRHGSQRLNRKMQRQEASITQENANPNRNLWSTRCRDLCSGYVTGTCRTANCLSGPRRRALTTSSTSSGAYTSEQNNRKTQGEDTYECTVLQNTAHNMMNQLIVHQQVSPPCQQFIDQNTRTVECFTDASVGEIERIQILHLDGRVITEDLPQTDYKLCRGIGAVQLIAVANECVYNVQFVLSETGSYNGFDYSAPFDAIPSIHQTGYYHLTVKPNSKAAQTKEYRFEVVDC